MPFNYFLFFIYALLLASGLATMVMAVLLTWKYHLKEIGYFSLYWFFLSLAVLMNHLHFFEKQIALLPISFIQSASVAGIAFFSGLSFLFYFLTALEFFGARPFWRMPFIIIILLASFITTVNPFLNQGGALTVYKTFKDEWYIIPAVNFIFISLIAVWMMLQRKNIQDGIRRKFFHPLWWLIVSFWPASIADILLNIYYPKTIGMPAFYTYYFIWNMISLYYAFSALSGSVPVPGMLTEAPPAFIREYALTSREEQMVSFIANGHSNKEIAYDMKISYDTVRTHVYNLYRKAGVRSRTELVRKINSFGR